MPALVTKATSRGQSPGGKTSTFVENFTDDSSPISPGSAGSPSKTGRPEAELVNVNGHDFAMIAIPTPSQSSRGTSAEPARAHSASKENNTPLRRSTRSVTRRQERTTNVQTSAEKQPPPEDRKDSAGTPAVTAPSLLWSPPSHHNLSDEIGLAITTPPADPPSPTPSPRPGAQSRATSREEDLNDAHSSSSSGPSPNVSSLDIPTDVSPPSPVRASDFLISADSVKVLPPPYNPFEVPEMQWISPSMACSRPDYMWSWAKRWTCCCCGGTTIVEQRVCSRLVCAHGRCRGKCCLKKITKIPPT